MEIDTGQSLCALDNPVVAGMQLLLFVNLAVFACSALLMLFRLLRHSPALPPWCRAYSLAALAIHGFWCLLGVFVLGSAFVQSSDEGATFLLSLEFSLVAAPSVLGLVLAWRIRRHAATDWTPALFTPAVSSPPGPDVLPHA